MTFFEKSPTIWDINTVGGRIVNNISCKLGETYKKNIVSCLCEGVGDDLKECLRHADINERKSNGGKLLKWDLINKNFMKKFERGKISTKYVKRGSWYMAPLIDTDNGYIYTVMREDRFSELRKDQKKRNKPHYLDALAQAFNADLSMNRQMHLFSAPHFESNEVQRIVDDMLEDFRLGASVISRYALIIFEEYHSEVTSVRCCLIDSTLQIVEEEDWSQYIVHDESTIVDVVEEVDTQFSLTLKPKALKKSGEKDLVAVRDTNGREKDKEII